MLSLLLLIFCSSTLAHKPLIEEVKVEHNRITIIPAQEFKERFLNNENFEVIYEEAIDTLPRSVLTIPFIMGAAPLVWISGEQYSVDAMDADTFTALTNIKDVFKLFYPHLSWTGELSSQEFVSNKSDVSSSYIGLLFSNGLDSVSSSFGHYDKEQLLITNHGVDVPLKKETMWESVKKQCKDFGTTYGKKNAFIQCNFCSIIDYAYLTNINASITKWWWLDSVTDALNHTSITAPLLYLKGCKHLYVAASHTETFPYPYGSHPLIDNLIAFAGIQVHHDQKALDRCDKVEHIHSTAKKLNLPLPHLRVCWSDPEGRNCLKCEKCLRTMNNILVKGYKPKAFGFLSAQETMEQTRKFLAQDPVKDPKIFWEWQTIQKHIKKPTTEYLSWLQSKRLDGQHYAQIHALDDQKEYFAALWRK